MTAIALKKKAGARAHTTGTVTGIRHGNEYGESPVDDRFAELSIQHGKPSKVPAHKIGSSPRRSHIHVPSHVARGLKVGQQVRVHVEGL